MNHPLLQKASIVLSPTAYGTSILNSIKPAQNFGDNAVTNGTFDTDSNWSKGTGWTISGGKANGSSTTGDLYQENAVTNGKYYRVTFTISDYVGGSVRVELANNSYAGTERSANGTYTETLLSGSTTVLFDARTSFTGSIDNVIVEEVLDFSFTRATTATRVNEDYLIEDVPYNLASYSENISVWDNFRVDVELSNVLNPFKSGYVYLVDDGTVTDNHYRKRPYIFLDSNNTYTQSFFVKKKDDGVYPVLRTSGVGGNSFVTFNWDTETLVQGSDITSSKVEKYNYGWYRISMVFSNLATTDFIIGISNDVNDDLPTYTGSNKGFYVWGCQIVKGDQPKDYLKTTDRLDIPRIDYTNGEPSILLEPSRTNLATYSQDFSQWSTISASATDNYATSPEGITNASRFLTTSTGAYLYLSSISVSNSTEYTISVYAKSNGNSLDDFRIYTSIGDSSTLTATSQWQRFTYTFTTSTTSINIGFRPSGTQNADIQIYGYQIEEGSYSTSLIHTSGSTVTRSADAPSGAGNSDLINASEGVLYFETIAFDDISALRMITIESADNNNRVSIGYSNTSNAVRVTIRVNGSNVVNQNLTASNLTNSNKFAFKYKTGASSIFLNGSEVLDLSSTSFTFSQSLTLLNLDGGAGTNKFYGKVKVLAVFKEVLTDAELTTLTS